MADPTTGGVVESQTRASLQVLSCQQTGSMNVFMNLAISKIPQGFDRDFALNVAMPLAQTAGAEVSPDARDRVYELFPQPQLKPAPPGTPLSTPGESIEETPEQPQGDSRVRTIEVG